MPTLSELFEEKNSDTITHRGRVIRSLVRIPVRNGDKVKVKRLNASDARPQALKLATSKGVLDVNGVRSPSVALWSNTSPTEVELTVRSSAANLEVWNAWSLGGVDSSWLGNCGIVTKPTTNGQILRCSDGLGGTTYTDLEVEITVVR